QSEGARRRSAKCPGVVGLHDVVARTGGTLESGAVEDRDDPAGVSDQAEGLQPARRDRDRGALRAQHLTEKLLRELEAIGSHAVVSHEQPARAARANGVTLIARQALRDLTDHRLRVAAEDPA